MTYPIGHVIYGCPFPRDDGNEKAGEQFLQILESWVGHDAFEDTLENDVDSPWNFLYSASPANDPAGYFGMQLYYADGYWELEPSMFQAPVPEYVREQVDAEWEQLPPDVKHALGRPRLALAWSDS